jgi:hypothetical protein
MNDDLKHINIYLHIRYNNYLATVAKNYISRCPGMNHNSACSSDYAAVLQANGQIVPPSSLNGYPWSTYTGENIAMACMFNLYYKSLRTS